jgi:hypothetical protein
MIARALLLLFVVHAVGCYLTVPEDIPCDADRHCPNNFTCELNNEVDPGVCLPGAPDLQLLGIVVEGEPRLATTIPTTEPQPLVLRIKNMGSRTAKAPLLALSPVTCMDQELDDNGELLDVDAGAEVDVGYLVTVQSPCPNPITIDWFSTFNIARATRGTFNVAFERGQ